MPAVIKKEWKKRRRTKACYVAAKNRGHSNLVAHLLSGRYGSEDMMLSALQSTIADLDKPDGLPDIGVAVQRIISAIKAGEVIGIETDHDADGVTSHAVIKEVLTKIIGYSDDKIRSYIGHRLNEGYGLSDSLASRIMNDVCVPTLVITADNGSSDEHRIARLKASGIDTIVTDHHEIPEEGIPLSAIAVVSPAREDSNYPDPLIAGCMVACLLMAAVRGELIKQGYFGDKTPQNVSIVFDYVALGTVADCVSMSRSKNNRLIVEHGLKRINKNIRPCWRALRAYLNDPEKSFTSEDLGFSVGPRINARGRLDEAMLGVRFLLTESDDEAIALARTLDEENTERKRIEKELKESALVISAQYVAQDYQSLVVFLEDGHPGVHGIVASRITEAYGRPSVVISPKHGSDSEVAASARGVPGFHVRDALQGVNNKYPGLLVKFGGHKGAAGMTINRCDIDRFREAFEQETLLQVADSNIHIGPVIMSDGPIPYDFISLNTIDEYNLLEPFGREMDSPLFEADLIVVKVGRMGIEKNHMRLTLNAGGKEVNGVWFNVDPAFTDEELGLSLGNNVRFLFSLSKNYFRGDTLLQLMIQDVRYPV